MEPINWNIIGHKKQLESLEKEIKNCKLSHAYLLLGPKHIGKATIAKKMAEIFLGQNKNSSVNNLKIFEDNQEALKISEIREIGRQVNLTHTGNYQIFIIENIERMRTEAQNAFLKTLEEPPKGTIFILTCDQPDKILNTIFSRTRNYWFSSIDTKEIEAYLKENHPQESAENWIQLFSGKIGLIIKSLSDEAFLNKMKEIHSITKDLFESKSLNAKFKEIEKIQKEPNDLKYLLNFCENYIQKELHLSIQNKQNSKKINDWVNLFEVLEKTRYFIERNVNKKLALENFAIAIQKQK